MKYLRIRALSGILGILLAGCSTAPPPFPFEPITMKPISARSPVEMPTNTAVFRMDFPSRPIPHAAPPESPKHLDIPRYGEDDFKSGHPFFYYTTAKQREMQLKLSAPELAQDEVLLRIWWTYQTGLTQPGALLEVSKNNGEWAGRVFEYNVTFDTWNYNETVANIRRVDFIPSSGWETFERILDENEIPTLLACDYVKDYDFWLREYFLKNPPQALHTYSVEYATPDTYRFYMYVSPLLIRDKVREANLFCTFGDELTKLGGFVPSIP